MALESPAELSLEKGGISRVQQVMREAHRAFPTRLKQVMDSAQIDPEVGIGVKKLDDVPPIIVEGQKYFFYGARVFPKSPGKMPFVKPHLHKVGEEPYFFPDMGGEMNFGSVVDLEGPTVQWKDPFAVVIGSEVVIKPGEVHSFRNIGAERVDFMFACPESHLADHSDRNPNGDRYIVANLKNGIPPHYGIN